MKKFYQKLLCAASCAFFCSLQANASAVPQDLAVWDLTDLPLTAFQKGVAVPEPEEINKRVSSFLIEESTYNPAEDVAVFTRCAGIFSEKTLLNLTVNRLQKKAIDSQATVNHFLSTLYLDENSSETLKTSALNRLMPNFGEDQNQIYNFIMRNRTLPPLERWNALFAFILCAHGHTDLLAQEADLLCIINTIHVPQEFQTRAKINLGKIFGGLRDPAPAEDCSIFPAMKVVYGILSLDESDENLRAESLKLYEEL